MRKPLGILLVVIGLAIALLCIYDLINSRPNNAERSDRSNFITGLVLGSLLAIVGFIFINSHKKKEAERLQMTQRTAPPLPDHLSQLEKLAGLKEQGMITEAEFQQQRDKLLS